MAGLMVRCWAPHGNGQSGRYRQCRHLERPAAPHRRSDRVAASAHLLGAQIVIHTTTLCGKALAGQAEDFIVLDVGIARSGEVPVGFPLRRPYNAICGIGVSAFGLPKRGF
jgi:hypothetical protein